MAALNPLQFKKLGAIEKELPRKRRKSSEQPSVVKLLVRTLFNLLINPMTEFKTLFLEDGGCYALKKILKHAFSDGESEVYCYVLGMIPPICYYDATRKDIEEQGILELLSDHVERIHAASEKGSSEQLFLYSPLLLAMRAVISRRLDL